MDLWSKGLGKRVLNLKLNERTQTDMADSKMVITGVMGPPVYWDYTVKMTARDITEFLEMLTKGDAPTTFIGRSAARWRIIGTAVSSLAVFTTLTVLRFLGIRKG